MIGRRALAKAYVRLMDQYSAEQVAAAVAPVIAQNKINVDLLIKDISAELLVQKNVVTGTLAVAHTPSDAQIIDIKRALANTLGVNDINLDILVDKELIGGFVAETPAGTVDASVMTMLERIEVA